MATKSELQIIISAKDKATEIVNSVGNSLNSFKSRSIEISKTVAAATAVIGTASIALGTKAVQASIAYENALMGLSTVSRAFGVDQDKAKNAALELAKDGLMPVSEAAAGLKNLLASHFSLDESVKLMNALKDSAAFNRQGFLDFGQAVVGATEGIKNGNSMLVDNAGITKNLSVILTEAGKSQNDLMNATTDASVRQVLYNGILKEASTFQGDSARSAQTAGGAFSQLNTSVNNLLVAMGDQLKPQVLQAVSYLNSMANKVGENKEAFRMFGQIISSIAKTIVSEISFTEKVFEVFFYGIFRGIDLAKTAWDTFKNIVKSVASSIVGYLKPVIDAINFVISGYNKIPGVDKISKINIDGRATGGPVMAGRPYMVGERGPELFVPSQSGNIQSNGSTAGASTTVNVQFDFTGANIVDRDGFIRQIKDALATDMRLASLGVR